MFKLIFRKGIKIPKIEDLESYLFVGPHPDDIEISSGATIKKLTSLGKKVYFLIVTDGRVGSVDKSLSEEELVNIRHDEAIESAKVLGVEDVTFLPFHDGDDYDIKEVEKEIMRKIIEIKPDIVFMPDCNVRTEAHPDHINVGKAAMNAVMKCEHEKITNRIGLKGCYKCNNIALFYTDKPNSYVKCKQYLKDKIAALRCHKSQFDEDGFKTLELYFKLNGLRLGIKKCTSFCEGFRVLTQAHLHCLPEAELYF